MPYFARRALERVDVVVADLVPEPAAAGMDHDGDPAGGQAEDARGAGVVDLVHHLHFDEVVPGAERADLAAAALVGARADGVRVGALDAAAALGALQVLGPAEAPAHDPGAALGDDAALLGVGEPDRAGGADAGGDIAEHRADERLHAAGHRLLVQVRPQHAHAAVDVVPDSAGRNHAALGRVGRGDAADGKTVAPVDVRHRQGGRLDPRQEGDVRHLLGGLVLADGLDEALVGEDDAVGPHARLVLARDAHAPRVHPLQRPVPVVRHGPSPQSAECEA